MSVHVLIIYNMYQYVPFLNCFLASFAGFPGSDIETPLRFDPGTRSHHQHMYDLCYIYIYTYIYIYVKSYFILYMIYICDLYM